MRRERLWWCLPAAVLCAADGVLTLWGQPPEYWSSGFAQVREGHPVPAWFLQIHPLAFAAAGVPYLLLVAALVLWLPRFWAVLFAVAVAAGHALAVIAWCRNLFPEPVAPVVVAAIAVGGCGFVAWRIWSSREMAADESAA